MSRGTHTVEQAVKCCNCMCAPPLALCVENNEYVIKEKGGKQIGIMNEDSSCICRTCVMPWQRTSHGTINID